MLRTVNAEKSSRRVGAGALLGGGLGVLFRGGGAVLGEGLPWKTCDDRRSEAAPRESPDAADRLAYRSLGGGQRRCPRSALPVRKAGRAVREALSLGNRIGTACSKKICPGWKAAHERGRTGQSARFIRKWTTRRSVCRMRNIMERVMDDVIDRCLTTRRNARRARCLASCNHFWTISRREKRPPGPIDLHGWRAGRVRQKAGFFARSADPATSAMRDIRRIFR